MISQSRVSEFLKFYPLIDVGFVSMSVVHIILDCRSSFTCGIQKAAMTAISLEGSRPPDCSRIYRPVDVDSVCVYDSRPSLIPATRCTTLLATPQLLLYPLAPAPWQ